jgi:hypothetical protein
MPTETAEAVRSAIEELPRSIARADPYCQLILELK